jgi:hypothetical protein
MTRAMIVLFCLFTLVACNTQPKTTRVWHTQSGDGPYGEKYTDRWCD